MPLFGEGLRNGASGRWLRLLDALYDGDGRITDLVRLWFLFLLFQNDHLTA